MLPTQNADTDMLIGDAEERAALAKCQSQCHLPAMQCPFVRKARALLCSQLTGRTQVRPRRSRARSHLRRDLIAAVFGLARYKPSLSSRSRSRVGLSAAAAGVVAARRHAVVYLCPRSLYYLYLSPRAL